ncbi:hypothetical protein [Bhargavaea cecembensis]|uniref:hypothetical protein n=1 Tax=Bhargavaea cecembensis TaxID=394098 RepID=UPI0011788EC0|nr:hypothetical protein [Bhargavaea cecembensis]
MALAAGQPEPFFVLFLVPSAFHIPAEFFFEHPFIPHEKAVSFFRQGSERRVGGLVEAGDGEFRQVDRSAFRQQRHRGMVPFDVPPPCVPSGCGRHAVLDDVPGFMGCDGPQVMRVRRQHFERIEGVGFIFPSDEGIRAERADEQMMVHVRIDSRQFPVCGFDPFDLFRKALARRLDVLDLPRVPLDRPDEALIRFRAVLREVLAEDLRVFTEVGFKAVFRL